VREQTATTLRLNEALLQVPQILHKLRGSYYLNT
jgi:hypothetical protein